MNPQTIRTIDYWFGRPICCLLTLFCSSFSSKTHKPKKIVFLKFIEQGATVLACSAIKCATEIVGRENVYFCVFESYRNFHFAVALTALWLKGEAGGGAYPGEGR
jgi:hypothetical protein